MGSTHYTNIAGTSYKIKGGRVNIGGSNYGIKYGIANTGTTGYYINFSNAGAYAMLYSDGNMIFQNSDEVKSGKTLLQKTNNYNTYTYDGANISTAPWVGNMGTIKAVSFDSGAAQPTDMDRWFCEARNLTSFSRTNINYNAITTMHGTFDNCILWTGPAFCGTATTNMRSTYYNCQNLTGSPACGAAVVNLARTYDNCRKITGSPVCGAAVTNMYGTYEYCIGLTGAPVCGTKVTNLASAYAYCNKITGSPVCGAAVTNMAAAYYNCQNLTGSPVCGANVMNLANAYTLCAKLTGSPVCGTKVTNMYQTYYKCANLTNHAVIGNAVTFARNAYTNCNKLDTLIYVKATNLTNAAGCFSGGPTGNLRFIVAPTGNTLNTLLKNTAADSIIGTAMTWTTNNTIYHALTNSFVILPSATVQNISQNAALHTSGVLRFAEKNAAANSSITSYYNRFLEHPLYWEPETDDGSEEYAPAWYTQRNNIKNVQFANETKFFNGMYLFASCRNLTTFNTTNFNLGLAKSLYGTFEMCYNLTASPSTLLATASNATIIDYVFYGCNKITGSAYCPSTATSMSYSYYNCQKITGSPAIGSKVTTIPQAYNNCRNLTSIIDIPANVVSMASAFRNCINLGAKNFNIGNKVTTMSYAFYNCTKLNGNIYIGSSVTNMAYAFYNCVAQRNVVRIASNKVSNMTNCFYNINNIRIYMKNNLTMLNVVKNSFGRTVTWTTQTAGAQTIYYNSSYVLYIYYNSTI